MISVSNEMEVDMNKNYGKNGNDVRKSGRSMSWQVVRKDVIKVKKKVLGGSSWPEENDVWRRRVLREEQELKERINALEEQGLLQPDQPNEIPFMSDKGNGEFEQIIEKEKKQKEDRAVWKAYSKRGGISDILMDIRKAIECPSANAFEFDEEEGMYIIFITLNNTYISRLTALCSEVCNECERIRNMEDSDLKKEGDGVQRTYDDLISEKEKLDEEFLSFKQQLEGVWRTPKEEREQELKRLEKKLDSYQKKRDGYISGVKTYQERLSFIEEKYKQQKSYTSQYGALLEELTGLGEIGREEHPFHTLTVSPESKEELEQYMETAYAFSKWALQMIQEYPL